MQITYIKPRTHTDTEEVHQSLTVTGVEPCTRQVQRQCHRVTTQPLSGLSTLWRVTVHAMPPFRPILSECFHIHGYDLSASLRMVNLLSPHALSNTVSQDFHFFQVYRPLSGALLTSFIQSNIVAPVHLFQGGNGREVSEERIALRHVLYGRV